MGLIGLTITGGDQHLFGVQRGGAVYSRERLEVAACIIADNARKNGSGGGIYSDEGELTVSDSSFIGNLANSGGGILNNRGVLTVVNSTFNGNSAGGTAIWNQDGVLNISQSTISNSENPAFGAVLSQGLPSLLTITDTTINGNVGGGVTKFGGNVTITRSTISGNSTAYHGGGIYSRGGNLTVTDSTISGNTASSNGGIRCQHGISHVGSESITLVDETGNAWGSDALPTAFNLAGFTRGRGQILLLTRTPSLVSYTISSLYVIPEPASGVLLFIAAYATLATNRRKSTT